MAQGKYYRHFKGNYYMVVSEAKDSETLEDLVVYKALYGDCRIWVRSKAMFYETVSRDGKECLRFSPVSKKEVLGKVKECFCFPDIKYTNDYLHSCASGAPFSKGVKGMVTRLKAIGEIPSDWNECANDDDLDALIMDRIKQYRPGDSLREIFNLIQTWGGLSGRNIYIHGLDWANIEAPYKALADCCLSMTENTEKQRDILIDAIREFDSKVQSIGLSFITKHTRYWLTRNLGMNALPIFDSIMANNVLVLSKTQNLSNLKAYWNAMTAKSVELGIGLIPLERQLFQYFLDN